jgi:homocysteine S-methyltransferase
VSVFAVEPFAVVDGGLSTALAALGHESTGLLWTAQLVIDRPDVVTKAHRTFVDAGADIVITSSYQASTAGFERAGLSRSAAHQALLSTTELARRADARFVAASVGPFGATLGDGSEYHGTYTATWDEVRSFHRERLAVLCDSGADLLAIETMPGRVEAEIVLQELQHLSTMPAWLTVTCRDIATTCAGDDITDLARLAHSSPNLVGIGVNCTDPRLVADLLRGCREATSLPLVAYPNHGGAWDAEHHCWVGDSEHGVGDRVAEWYESGARFIGGCCGVGPDGIGEIVSARSALACPT